MVLSDRIRKARIADGLTQKELSIRSVIAVSYISRLENGRIIPSLATLRKLAESLSESLLTLVGAQGNLDWQDRCPVTRSGKCTLDLPFRSGEDYSTEESYSTAELRLLHACNHLLKHSDPQVRQQFVGFVETLVGLVERRDSPQEENPAVAK
jgi:transcriptional regulator with XRE-family HTH domain